MVVFTINVQYWIKVVDINFLELKIGTAKIFEITNIWTWFEKLLRRCRNKTNTDRDLIEEADMIFLSVNTPTKLKGWKEGKWFKWDEASARQIAKYAKITL